MEEEDRISLLPDFLLAHILSRLLYTEEAIRTGILSKRWRRLWTLLPKLKFSYDLFGTEKRSVGDFLSFVDQTLTHCGTQFNLHKFALGTRRYAKEFQSQVNDFLHYAVSRNVQELELVLQNIDHVIDFELRSDFMFTNSCLTSLTLSGLKILPVGTICWNKLRSLCIAHVKLDESLLQNILSGSPFLEYLCLTYCYGIRQIDITSKSVKEFMFSGYRTWGEELVEFPDIIEINAPHILALTIKQYFFILKPILLNVSSLVQAKLDYEKEYHGTMQNGAAQELLKLYILRLSHVKELIIGTSCSKAFRRLKSKGFTFPSNLKIVDVSAPSQSDSNEIGDSEEALLDDIWF